MKRSVFTLAIAATLRLGVAIVLGMVSCLAGSALADTATVVSGYTTPPTLEFYQSSGPLEDTFSGSAIDRCLWEERNDAGYTSMVSGGAWTVSGSGNYGSRLGPPQSFSATSYTASVVISAASAPYRISLATFDSDGEERLSADIFVNSTYNSTISIRHENQPAQPTQDSATLFMGTPIPLPFTLSLIVDSAGPTAKAEITHSGGTTTVTIPLVPTYTEAGFDLFMGADQAIPGSVSADSFTSTFTLGARYKTSAAPLSVFGTDYDQIPFDSPPSTGHIFLEGEGKATLVESDGACIPSDGSADIFVALITFNGAGGAPVTLYTPLDQTAVASLIAGVDPSATLDCYGTGFTSAGAGSNYTFTPPECTCGDLTQNGDETDVDCGGSCSTCADGEMCSMAGDCASGVCSSGTCAAPSCSDSARNGDETDVDCGGSCGACGDGGACVEADDCASGVCSSLTCAAPSCSDGVQNGTETGIDCGGTCPACAAPGCSAAPLGTCRAALTSSFKWSDDGDTGAKDKLGWTWAKGEETSVANLDDPTDQSDYRLCVYDNGANIAQAEVSGGTTCGDDNNPCWTLNEGKGYTFKDKAGSQSGITGVKLSAGIDGKAAAKLKGKGTSLPDITLPVTGPLVVQLQNLDTAICFTASYSGEQIKKNDAVKGKLSAKTKLESLP